MGIKERFGNNPLLAVFFTVFVDLVGFGILIPVIPLLLADPESSFYILPSNFSIETGYMLLGVMIGLYSLMTFISAPIIGQLSDKFGRRKLLILSLVGTCLGYLIFAYGIIQRNLLLLFIGRAIDGITGGNISVAQAAIADVTAPKDRAKNFGLIGMAFGLGFILGPYIGGKLSDSTIMSFFNASTPFFFAAALSFLNILSVAFFLPETHKTRDSAKKINLAKSVSNIFRAFTMGDMKTLFTSVFMLTSGFTFFTSFFSVFLIDRFSFSPGQIGDFFAYIGICTAITQGVITRAVAKRFTSDRVVRVGIFGMGFALLLYFLPTVPWQVYLIAPVFSIFNGLVQANLPAIVSSSVGSDMQGEILGINASVQALAQALPPILSGFIAARLTPVTPLLIASIVIISAGIFYNIFHKPMNEEAKIEHHNIHG